MEQQQATTPTEVAPEPSLDQRILGHFGYGETEPEAQEPAATPAQEHEATEEEVYIPDEEVQPSSEPVAFELEIKHNGETKKLTSKEEAVRLAQMGTDYEFKMSRVREDAQRIQTMAQAAQAKFAMQAQALDALAEAKSYERSLKSYANVDWAQAAQANPQEAFQARMAFDQLQAAHQAAMQKVHQFQQPIQQATQAIDQAQQALELQKLTERLPEWKDQSRKDKDSAAIMETLTKSYGVTQEELSAPAVRELMNSHKFVSILRDAWKYREAVNTKGKKGPPQGLPQVAKPGANVPGKSPAQQMGDLKRALNQPNVSSKARKAIGLELVARKFGLKD
jgi:hypothetical protein